MTYIKKIFTERNLVIILFVTAFCIFSLAQEDTRRIERKQHNSSFSRTTPDSPAGRTAEKLTQAALSAE